MDLKRLATLIFNAVVWLAFIALLFMWLCGIYKGIQSNKPKEAEAAEHIEPVEAVQQLPVATTEEESEVVVTESEVVMLSCSVAEKPNTAQSEAPVTLYNVPLDADLQRFIIGKAEEIGIDPAVIFAMAYKESTYNPGAIGDYGNSLGLLQIQPRWNMERMERLGCLDLLDPFQNVTVAADLLSDLMDKHGDVAVALTVYNYGHFPGYITEYASDVMQTAEKMRGGK